MRKILIVVLIIVALPLYSYDIYLLLFHSSLPKHLKRAEKNAHHENASYSFERFLLDAAPVRFIAKGRDPFALTIATTATSWKKKPASKVDVESKEIVLPAITLKGILWNPEKPVAILMLSDGSKTIAKIGQQIDDNVIVKCIERKSITVLFRGKEFIVR